MKKIFTVLSIFVCLLSIPSFGQEGIHQGQLSNPIPENFLTASPDVASFQKINALPVSLYTGKIDVSIPIYEIKSGNISIPILINYNSGGVKVDDFASSVGTNWSLNAGGSIVRIVKDLPDNEASYRLFAESDWDHGLMLNPWLASYGYNRKTVSEMQNYLSWGALNRHAIYVDSPTYNSTVGNIANYPGNSNATRDMSPDLFIANAPGLSTKYTSVNSTNNAIYPNNNNGFLSTFLGGSGVKMESLIVDRRTINGVGFFSDPSQGNHHGRIYHPIKDFFEFNILNTSGLQYKFADEEVSESFHTPLGTEPVGGFYSAINTWETMISNNYNKRIHTWNLTSITDKKSNKSVVYTYEEYSNNNTVANTYVNSTALVSGGPNSFDPRSTNACTFKHNPVTSYDYTGSHTNLQKHPKRKRLTKISFDEGEVVFIYGIDRQDYQGEKVLTEIQIKDFNGNLIQRIRFHYSYFISKENCLESDCKRLKLDKVDYFGKGETFNSFVFEYEYTNKLPKRGSLQQDFLGYYNNNGVNGVSNGSVSYTPILYFYENQGIHTILPFRRTNATPKIISGQLNLTPNAYSLTGLLKKITYPTGGTTEFEYENNSFKFQGATYLSGGARIKSQTLKNNGVQVKRIEYEYKETDGSTSGYINNIPIYGYLEQFQRSPFSAYKVAVYDKPKGGLELTSGSYVGYSRVIEKELNNGYVEYNYSSPKNDANIPETRIATTGNPSHPDPYSYDCSTKFINNSQYPSVTYIDNDYKRGKLETKKVYDSSNRLLAKEDITFTPRILSSLNIQRAFKIQAKFPSDANDAWDEGSLHILNISSSIPVAQDLQTQVIKTEYPTGGTIITTNQTVYDGVYPFPVETRFIDGPKTIIDKYYYPFSSGASNGAYMSSLRSQNRISELVKFEQYEGAQKLLTQTTNYFNFGNNLYLPQSLSTSKGNESPKTNGIIDRRDAKGNITQMHTIDNVYTTLLYGYNKSLPIAKIENATFSQVASALGIATSTLENYTEAHLTSINNLRTLLPNARVTTLTHLPMVGVHTVTDPRGRTIYYSYDTHHRLLYVKDHEGKVLSKNEYHYKN